MNPAIEAARILLERMIAGERGDSPLYLAMLLEKSSPLSNSDDHYRQILPLDLAELRLTANEVDKINALLLSEIRRNPDAAFISAASFTGSGEVTKAMVGILIRPPRLLNTDECRRLLAVVNSFLPSSLDDNPQFLSNEDKKQLVERMRSLKNADDMDTRKLAISLIRHLKNE